MRYELKFIYFLFFVFIANTLISQCGVTDTVIAIADNEQAMEFKLIVEGYANNDLSNPNQGVCGVTLKYNHTKRSELTIDLISPAGQKVGLVGPYVPNNSLFGTIRWDISFVRCSDLAGPDVGKEEHFNSTNDWYSNQNGYTGVYYPFDYCLEDFNSGPVNGTWTFVVHDHSHFYKGNLLGYTIEFCDGSSLECDLCEAYAGEFDYTEYEYCEDDDNISIDISHNFDGKEPDAFNYNYEFIVAKDNVILKHSTNPDLNFKDPGEYTICGLSYHKNDSLGVINIIDNISQFNAVFDSIEYIGSPYCADITDTCIVVKINTVDTVRIDSSICEGDTLYFQGEKLFSEGKYYFKSNEDCDSAYLINLSLIKLSAGIDASNTTLHCNQDLILKGQGYISGTGMTYKWLENLVAFHNDYTKVYVGQPGDYSFVLTQGSCTDTATISIDADADIPLLDFNIPEINCANPTVQLSVSSSNATLDSVNWYNGALYTGTTIFTSEAGHYLVQAYGNSGCKASEAIEVPIDTIKPVVSITANDLTCDEDTAFMHIETVDTLKEIYWIELNQYGSDVYVLDSGIYHVSFIGVNGCTGLDSIKVNSFKEDFDFTIRSDTLNCFNNSGKIDFVSSQDSLTFIWITPAGDSLYTEDIPVNSPGIYKYHITNKYGCSVSGKHKVVENVSKPAVSFAQDTLYLSCGTSLHLQPNIDMDYVSVFWGGPGNFHSSLLDPSVDFEGKYYINVIGTNGCSGKDSIMVLYDNTVPDIKIITDTINCADSYPFLHVIATGDYAYKWEDPFKMNYFGKTMTGLENVGGFYYLTVTDNANNCENVFFTYVPTDTMQPSFEFVYSNLLDCAHDSLILKYKSDDSIVDFHWQNANSDFDGDSLIVYGPGVVHGRLTAASGCYSEDSTLVKQDDGVFLEDSTLYLNCYNDLMVKLGVERPDSDYLYTWSGNGFSSFEPNPTVDKAGVYKLVVSTPKCLDSAEYTVGYDTLTPVIGIDFPNGYVITCQRPYVNYEVDILSFIDAYYWSGDNYFSTKTIDTLRDIGTFICHARGHNGCHFTDTFYVAKSRSFPEVEAFGVTLNCKNAQDSLKIMANINGDYTDLYWEGPNGYKSYSVTNEVTDTGNYIIHVRNGDDCSDTDTAKVVIDFDKPDIIIDSVGMITCYNDTIKLSPKISADSFLVNWRGPFEFSSDSTDIAVTRAGEYIIEVEPENGCVKSDTFNVSVNKLKPLIILDGENLNCCSSTNTIELKTTADNFTQNWTFPDNTNSTNRNIIIADAGTYKVEVMDLENGCKAIDSVRIKWDSIRPHIKIDDYFLNCDTSKIEMIAYADQPDVKFIWYGPGFVHEGNKVYTNKSGNYYIVAEGNNCCTSSKEFNVSEAYINPDFEVFGGTLNCNKDSVKLKAIRVQDDYSLEWKGPNGFVSNDINPVVYEPGQYVINVVGQNKCDSSALVLVDIDTIAPEFEIKYFDSLKCAKETGEVEVNVLNSDSISYVYSWYTENGSIVKGQFSDKMTFSSPGLYTLHLTNSTNGCFAIDSIEIASYDYKLDSARIVIKPPSCYGYSDAEIEIDSVFGGKMPYSYSLDNYWFSNNNSYNSKDAGVYNIYIKDFYGCVLDTNIVIPDGADVQLQLGADKDNIFLGDSVRITAIVDAKNGVESYYWTPELLFNSHNDSIQIVKLQKSTNISLMVVDSNGCVAEDKIWIKVKGKPDVYVPNIFTPDGDGLNDYFYIRTGSGVKNINRLMIYDNWGEKLFDKKNLRINVPIDGWNGKFKGRNVRSGVYVYVFELELEDDSIYRIAGDVTIIK